MRDKLLKSIKEGRLLGAPHPPTSDRVVLLDDRFRSWERAEGSTDDDDVAIFQIRIE